MSSKLPLVLRNCCILPGRASFTLLRTQDSLSSPCASKLQKKLFSTENKFPCYVGFKRYQSKQRKAFFNIRREVGPEPLVHRNVWPNWNYDAEIFAFGQRLGEDTTAATFRLAFTHESYVKQEMERRKELQISEPHQIVSAHQGELKILGEDVMKNCVPAFCRFNFPYLPEEGIEALANHLLETDVLAYVSRHLGTSDLIQCAELPPSNSTLAETLLAVIGALAQESGITRAQHFILDFVMTSLLNLDVNELFQPKNPMGVVAEIVKREGFAEPESRLLRKCGEATPEALFLIGVYSDKKLIGQSFGETLLIAEEMAARDTLRRLFRTTINRRPMAFGQRAKNINLPLWSQTPNVRMDDWCHSSCQKLLDSRLTGKSLLQEETRKTKITLN